MERTLAASVVTQIDRAVKMVEDAYIVQSFGADGSYSYVEDFHRWVDWKELVGAFLVESQISDDAYYLLFIDWRELQDFNLVIYPSNKSNPLIILHEIETIYGERFNLCWTYSPTRRDGRNPQRKILFQKIYHSSRAEIILPRSVDKVKGFLDEVFRLCDARIQADNLQEDKLD